MDTSYIKTIDGVPTGLAIITVGEKDNTIVVVEGANKEVTVEYVREVEKALLECEIVLLQHEIPQETIEYVIEFCYEHGIKAVLNPGPARPVKAEIIEKVTYLTPNEHEAVIIFGDRHSFERNDEKVSGKTGDHTGFKGSQYLFQRWRNPAGICQKGKGSRYNRSG